MPSPPPQAVPAHPSRPSKPFSTHPPPKTGASPMSYGGMTGISFTNGGGFSFGDRSGAGYGGMGATPKSFKWSSGAAGSFGHKFYGDGGESPTIPFSTSITMDANSFVASSAAFNLPMSASYRRSYASALSGREINTNTLSSSLASLSTHPAGMGMSFGSYNKSTLASMMALRSDAELTKAYECCGAQHAGLHALLEHVEDAHPYDDHDTANAGGFSPITLAMDLDLEGMDVPKPSSAESASTRSSLSPNLSQAIPNYPLPKTISDTGSSSALQLSDVLTSPPEASIQPPLLTSHSSSPDSALPTPTTSTNPSPSFSAPKIQPPARSTFLGANANISRSKLQQNRFERGFNEVVAGRRNSPEDDTKAGPTAVAPGVLFASAVAGLGIPTGPPMSAGAETSTATAPTPVLGVDGKMTEPALPPPSLFTTHKPWRCPNPGCNKAYKQSNGLKYHQQKGVCDYQIHDAVDLGLTLEEAEERSRPFVCAVGSGCNKRYRQMNGLKVG
ncbi:transcription factor SFP1, partial [Tremellales sp. Uapishka_1]